MFQSVETKKSISRFHLWTLEMDGYIGSGFSVTAVSVSLYQSYDLLNRFTDNFFFSFFILKKFFLHRFWTLT